MGKKMKTSKYLKIAILSMLIASSLIYYFQVSTGNFAGIIFVGISFYVLSKIQIQMQMRECVITSIFSAIIAMCLVIGKIGTSNRSILDSLQQFRQTVIKDENTANIIYGHYNSLQDGIVVFITWLGVMIVVFILLYYLKKILDTTEFSSNYNEKKWLRPSTLSLIMIACWMPYFIYNYPGILTYDSVYQISQIEGDLALNSHHPVLHTFLIGICYNIGKRLFGVPNIGVALYSLIQMGILAIIYSYAVYILYKNKVNTLVCVAIYIFYALVPFNAMYAITMWKDILFAAFVLWFSVTLFVISIEKKITLKRWIQLFISGLLLTLFRANGLVALILCMPFTLLLLKSEWKKILCSFILGIAMYMVISGPIYSAMGVNTVDDISESLSIPMQHIARVVVDHSDELSDYDKNLIEQIAPLYEIQETYNCRFSDPIKKLVRSHKSGKIIEDNKSKYAKLWFSLGLKYPIEYVRAEIDATVGYWYPDEQYNIVEVGVYPNDYGIYTVTDTSNPTWSKVYKWHNSYREIPLVGNLYSIGSMYICLLISIYIGLVRKKNYVLLMACPSFMVWATIMIATPLHSEMRYIYGMILTVPVLLGTILGIEQNGQYS